jgi:hypothetical protein
VEVFEQRREEMLREEELDRLREALLRADRGRPSAPRWASAAAWEARRALSLLRKRCLRAPGDPD